MKEKWKDIAGYEGLYQVSNLGNIKNSKGSLIGQPVKNRGYRAVGLSKNNKVKTFNVHRIVAIAFIENEFGKPQINHIDGDKLNNEASNLEWVTDAENKRHAVDMGLAMIPRGDQRPNTILSTEEAIEVKRLLSLGWPPKKIAMRMMVEPHIVRDIKYGKAWKWLEPEGIA